MINGYEIKSINNEEVLYIYMDLDLEFSRNFNKRKKDIKNHIKNYIKDNNINFKGAIVTIIVGGVMLGTITLNKPQKQFKNSINTNNIVSIITDSYLEEKDNKDIKEKEIIYDELNDNDKKEDIKDNVSDAISNIKKEIVSDTNTETNKEDLKPIENNDINIQAEEVVDNNVYVNLYRSNGSVINIELEEYIIGVVGAEMPASFNIEALKAQAIVARTYALKTINSNKRLTDNNNTQNYKSNDELRNMWGGSYNVYYNKISNAVYATKGLYLTYNGNYIDAVYHSTSNGFTEDSVYVWGNNIPYLKSVSSSYDNTNKNFVSTVFYTYEDISNRLNNRIDINTDLSIVNKNNSGRVINITINEVEYTGISIRSLLNLRSTDFEFEKVNNGVNIITKGYGHGVGMSQYGANGMANNGYSYRDILLHYYTGVSINSL